MGRTRGPGASHDRRRAEIIAAVARLAAERGIPAVSQSAVAAAAGVSPGRVQHYFPTRDAMLTAARPGTRRPGWYWPWPVRPSSTWSWTRRW